MRISDWSSDVCSSDLLGSERGVVGAADVGAAGHPDHVVERRDALAQAGKRRGEDGVGVDDRAGLGPGAEIGSGPCRDSVCLYVWSSVVAVSLTKETRSGLDVNRQF